MKTYIGQTLEFLFFYTKRVFTKPWTASRRSIKPSCKGLNWGLLYPLVSPNATLAIKSAHSFLEWDVDVHKTYRFRQKVVFSKWINNADENWTLNLVSFGALHHRCSNDICVKGKTWILTTWGSWVSMENVDKNMKIGFELP